MVSDAKIIKRLAYHNLTVITTLACPHSTKKFNYQTPMETFLNQITDKHLKI